jgi:AcrR family transcriptional regulator
MRVSSISSNPVKAVAAPTRREPQQDRATRRVEAFLEAAEAQFAEHGFEATTMTAVAEQSGSSIGALYSYFPDKRSLAMALLERYAATIEVFWKPLFDKASRLSNREFAESFLDRFLDFVNEHPAHLQLLSAPIRFKRDPAARRAFRMSVVRALQSKAPAMAPERTLLIANVVVQLVKGMMQMYADANAVEKPLIVAEFKDVLTLYLKHTFPKT